MKKLIWGFSGLFIFLLALLGIYISAMSSVTLINQSSQVVDEVILKLPSNRLSIGPIQPGTSQTIYRTAKQDDGAYQYQVVLEQEIIISGECGYITSNQYFTSFEITVTPQLEIICE